MEENMVVVVVWKRYSKDHAGGVVVPYQTSNVKDTTVTVFFPFHFRIHPSHA